MPAMPIDAWSAELGHARARTPPLRRQPLADADPNEDVALRELSLTYDKLSVAEEELRAKNEELERTYAVLEEERRRSQQLFHHAPVAYVVTDAFGSIRDANRSASDLLQYREEAVIGKPLVVFTQHASRRRIQRAIGRLRMGEDVITFGARVTAVSGPVIAVEISVAAGRNVRGELVELRWLLVDIRRRRKLERARRERATRLETLVGERTAELEHAQNLKDQLLATVSHELRTPLTAIGGYTELLSMGLRGRLTDDQLVDVNRIHRAYEHLARIVDDLLNFNKLVAHKLSFDIADVALADVVRGAWELTAPQAHDNGLRLELGDVPMIVVSADSERLRQIIVNLISNAVKFSGPGGTVVVRADTSVGYGVVCVEDTGPGIPEQSREAIFEPFVRLGDDSGAPGTGLGLAISRDMARAMGGDLTVASTVGVGSCFTLTVPASTRFATETVSD